MRLALPAKADNAVSRTAFGGLHDSALLVRRLRRTGKPSFSGGGRARSRLAEAAGADSARDMKFVAHSNAPRCFLYAVCKQQPRGPIRSSRPCIQLLKRERAFVRGFSANESYFADQEGEKQTTAKLIVLCGLTKSNRAASWWLFWPEST